MAALTWAVTHPASDLPAFPSTFEPPTGGCAHQPPERQLAVTPPGSFTRAFLKDGLAKCRGAESTRLAIVLSRTNLVNRISVNHA